MPESAPVNLLTRFRALESGPATTGQRRWASWRQQRLVKTGGRLVKHARYYSADAGREPSHVAAVKVHVGNLRGRLLVGSSPPIRSVEWR